MGLLKKIGSVFKSLLYLGFRILYPIIIRYGLLLIHFFSRQSLSQVNYFYLHTPPNSSNPFLGFSRDILLLSLIVLLKLSVVVSSALLSWMDALPMYFDKILRKVLDNITR